MLGRRLSLAWFVVPAAGLVAVLPLLLHGCSCGHDFDFHLVSWFEAAAQFHAGNLHPTWAFSPAWNAGEPRFVFYPPLSWTLGGLLGMVLPWAVVPVAYTWIALAAAGAGMYRLARELAAERAAVVAAAVYIANPYMIFTAYERTAYAELLAAAWIPLLLAGILRRRLSVLGVALPVALLWLTNAPAAVMGCYALALLAAFRLAWTVAEGIRGGRHIQSPPLPKCWDLIWRVAAGLTWGLGLAAFYIVPAAYERRWVQISMATLPGMNVWDNFLFQRIGDGPHDDVLHIASWIAVTMLAAASILLLVTLVRGKECRRITAALIVLVAAVTFMLTPLSAGLWRIAPEMSFLQFPWRLVAILSATACAGLALAFIDIKATTPTLAFAVIVVVTALCIPTASHFRQSCDEEDNVAARLAVFNTKSGSEPTDEYTPLDADNESLAQHLPPFWLSKDGLTDAPAGSVRSAPVPLHFAVQAPEPEVLVLNLRDYPAWSVRVNGMLNEHRIHRADGLVALPVNAGASTIDIQYVTTPDQRAGLAVSFASLCAALSLAAAKRRRFRSRIIEA